MRASTALLTTEGGRPRRFRSAVLNRHGRARSHVGKSANTARRPAYGATCSRVVPGSAIRNRLRDAAVPGAWTPDPRRTGPSDPSATAAQRRFRVVLQKRFGHCGSSSEASEQTSIFILIPLDLWPSRYGTTFQRNSEATKARQRCEENLSEWTHICAKSRNRSISSQPELPSGLRFTYSFGKHNSPRARI